MLKDLVRITANEAGIKQVKAKAALGVILNAAERQGSDKAVALFTKIPGARTLSARMGSELGAATGVVARLIERTPGGQRAVAAKMLADLQNLGLGHKQIGSLFGSLNTYAHQAQGISDFGHLGDFFGTSTKADQLAA